MTSESQAVPSTAVASMLTTRPIAIRQKPIITSWHTHTHTHTYIYIYSVFSGTTNQRNEKECLFYCNEMIFDYTLHDPHITTVLLHAFVKRWWKGKFCFSLCRTFVQFALRNIFHLITFVNSSNRGRYTIVISYPTCLHSMLHLLGIKGIWGCINAVSRYDI